MLVFRYARGLAWYVLSNSNQSWSGDMDPNLNVQPGSSEEQRTPCTRGNVNA